MSLKPLVSIITPFYNNKVFFEETFESVINQSLKDWEWIIVDDFSDSDQFDFLLKRVSKIPSIKVFRTEKNSGAAIARNIGLKNAKGRYIAFLDADDYWLPGKLEKQINFMKENNIVFCYTDYFVLNQKKEKVLFSPKSLTIDYKKMLKTNEIGCLTVIFDKEKIGNLLMPVDCPKREDYAMWLDILKKGIIAQKFPQSLGVYRLSQGSVSHKKLKLVKYHYRVYRKHENFSIVKSLFYLFIHSFNKIFRKY